jgi:CO dehydrogenase/acetyl-CoA synthase delta subunit
MSVLFDNWLMLTKKLQQDIYGANYDELHDNSPENLRKLIEYMRWNMLAIDDELAEVRKAISWKPWQHDEPYADRKEIIKECVDVLHFVANILCAAGATDDELDSEYLKKMQINAERQRKGYKVLGAGVKCKTCFRALDDYDVSQCQSPHCPMKPKDGNNAQS